MILIKKMGEKVTKFLSAETKIGLTFGQFIGVIVMICTLMGFYYDVKSDITMIQQKYLEMEIRVNKSEQNIEIIRQENRDDHQKLSEKIDKVLFVLQK